MKLKIEFLLYAAISTLVFCTMWYSTYVTSQDKENLDKLIGVDFVEVRKFFPLLGSRLKYITQDISINEEWNSLLKLIVYTSGFLLYLPFSIISSLFSRKIHQMLRITISIAILWHLLGSYIVYDVLLTTMFFLCIGRLLRGYPMVIWILGLTALYKASYILNALVLNQLEIFGNEHKSILSDAVYSTHFMALLRAISLALFACASPSFPSNNGKMRASVKGGSRIGIQRKSQNEQPTFVETCLDGIEYAFYLPTIIYGPMIVFSDWYNFIQKKIPERFLKSLGLFRRLTLGQLLGRAIRLMFAAAFWSGLTCFIYAKAIMSYPMTLNMNSPYSSLNPWSERGIHVPSWTLWSCLTMSGLGFYFFHVLIYGIPGLVADIEQYAIEKVQGWQSKDNFDEIARRRMRFNGLSWCLVPAHPSCVFRITLFSEMWRTFDRGLYGFMFTHIYQPVRGNKSCSNWTVEWLRKNLAHILPFCFVLLFHDINKQNTIWVTVNLLQFQMERLIRWADKNTSIGRKLREPNWIVCRERLLGLLHGLSLMTSLAGLAFFFFGYKVGMAFAKHNLFCYGSLVQLVAVYGLYFTDKYRENVLSYRGLPLGMYDAPVHTE